MPAAAARILGARVAGPRQDVPSICSGSAKWHAATSSGTWPDADQEELKAALKHKKDDERAGKEKKQRKNKRVDARGSRPVCPTMADPPRRRTPRRQQQRQTVVVHSSARLVGLRWAVRSWTAP